MTRGLWVKLGALSLSAGGALLFNYACLTTTAQRILVTTVLG